jgi:hypothetical protein
VLAEEAEAIDIAANRDAPITDATTVTRGHGPEPKRRDVVASPISHLDEVTEFAPRPLDSRGLSGAAAFCGAC